MADSPDKNSSGVLSLSITSNGAKLKPVIGIVSVSVEKAVNRIPSARIVLLDGDMPNQDFPLSNTDDFKPGSEIQIDAGYMQQVETIFKGVVVKHGIKITGNNYSRLVIECQDKAVAMTVGRKNANFVDSKDSDIIKKIIGNYSGLKSDVGSTDTSIKEVVQYYATDWDFALSRAEINGLLTIVDDGSVSVKAPEVGGAAVLSVTYGVDLMEFDAEVDARTQLASVGATAWDPKNQAVVESSPAAPDNLNKQGNLKAADLAKVIGLNSYRLQAPTANEKTELDSWAKAQQTKAELSSIRGKMKFQGSAKAKPGKVVELAGVGDRFNGNVFLTAVRHELVSGNWTTEAEFGLSANWFADRRDLASPPASGMLPGAEGLQIGVVKQLDEDPNNEFRIQVSVPVLQAETEGVWARLASFYASSGFGAFFIPEIGDEVVLGYFNNDPSYPVILGSLYSSSRSPAYTPTADNFIKAIVTSSELKVEFDDEKKIVTIITPGGNQIVISDEDESILLQDQNDNKVELGPSGITLDSPKDITITAKGKVTIDATGEIGITSKADVKVEGLNVSNTAQVGFTAKGNATAELSASGQTTVKGAVVMIN
ncbi:MAG: type VI secretion system tip protein VgrG [Chloroflexi bacterium]|nr:type VI secretion system tip protein VgrG [Chloroflexota bacterium]